ncbi:hypothetical protein BDA96_02G133100 [Sorghum bicolor]|uniref:Uncharacterized protein n=2 Tax=Sorghum bicolor TaxID=4558 RepID=A0A921USM5_SORBI|nr:hypothetical protein BDA96_02G133100 [Sorghum bicolor]KXG35057.1 hypothetical protein SORBI_3002G126700 [Sorghum bicolor]
MDPTQPNMRTNKLVYDWHACHAEGPQFQLT